MSQSTKYRPRERRKIVRAADPRTRDRALSSRNVEVGTVSCARILAKAPSRGLGLARLGTGRGQFWSSASSRSRSRWSGSSRCCSGHSSTLSSITTRRISSSSASSAVWRSRSAMRQARQPTGGGRPRTAPVARIHGDRGLHGPPRLRNGRRPLLREPRRLPDRDPDRAAGERILRCRLGVRRCASRPRAAVDPPAREAPGKRGIVMATWFSDARELAAAARTEQRGRDRTRARHPSRSSGRSSLR